MNTLELVSALRNSSTTKKFFGGVFPCDRLPQKIRKPACVVANTDPANKPGTHWVAFYFPKRGPAEFFDSFGKYPSNAFFKKFLLNNSASFVSNKKRLQSSFTPTCGHYCSMFLHARCKGKSLKSFLKEFSSSDLIFNDSKIIKSYRRTYLKTLKQSGGIAYNQSCKQCGGGFRI